MENWQVKPGHNVVEKIKNFQKIPDEKKHNQRVTILFTKQQLGIISNYCEKNNLTKGDFFREAVVSYLQGKNVNISLEPEPDPRQTKMF